MPQEVLHCLWRVSAVLSLESLGVCVQGNVADVTS